MKNENKKLGKFMEWFIGLKKYKLCCNCGVKWLFLVVLSEEL